MAQPVQLAELAASADQWEGVYIETSYILYKYGYMYIHVHVHTCTCN